MTRLPDHTTAAVLRRFGAPLELEAVPVPSNIEPGAMLVEVEACSICGTDLHLIAGNIEQSLELPLIPGHEMVGRIVALGAGAGLDSVGAPLRPGDRISWTHAFCGQCHACRVQKRPTLCERPVYYMYTSMARFPHLMGGFAQHCYVLPGSGRLRIPDEVPSALAAMSSCALRSVVHAFDACGRIEPWETVVIQGSGPLGILATGLAKIAGARRVVCIGGPEDRLALAEAFGADATVPIESFDDAKARIARVRELTGGRGGDVVMEMSGAPGAFAESLELAACGGRVLCVGQVGRHVEPLMASRITNRSLRVTGTSAAEVRHYWQALQLIADHRGGLPFDRLLTGRYPLASVNEALESTRARQQIKPVILPWPEREAAE